MTDASHLGRWRLRAILRWRLRRNLRRQRLNARTSKRLCGHSSTTYVCLRRCLRSGYAFIHTRTRVRHKLYAMDVGDSVFEIFSMHALRRRRRAETVRPRMFLVVCACALDTHSSTRGPLLGTSRMQWMWVTAFSLFSLCTRYAERRRADTVRPRMFLAVCACSLDTHSPTRGPLLGTSCMQWMWVTAFSSLSLCTRCAERRRADTVVHVCSSSSVLALWTRIHPHTASC